MVEQISARRRQEPSRQFCSASLIFMVPGSNITMATKTALTAQVPKPPPVEGFNFCVTACFFCSSAESLPPLDSRTHESPVTVSPNQFPKDFAAPAPDSVRSPQPTTCEPHVALGEFLIFRVDVIKIRQPKKTVQLNAIAHQFLESGWENTKIGLGEFGSWLNSLLGLDRGCCLRLLLVEVAVVSHQPGG